MMMIKTMTMTTTTTMNNEYVDANNVAVAQKAKYLNFPCKHNRFGHAGQSSIHTKRIIVIAHHLYCRNCVVIDVSINAVT
jgi:hypothetical protein